MSDEPGSLRAKAERLAAQRQQRIDPDLLARLAESAEAVAYSVDPLPQRPQVLDCGAARRVAVEDTFSLDELALAADSDEAQALLANADTVMIDGRRRLRLQADSRADFLRALPADALQTTLQLAAATTGRSAAESLLPQTARNSYWLRRWLSGEQIALDQQPVDELRAAVLALEQLQPMAGEIGLPPLEQVQRALGLAEWLEPLRLLVGADGKPAAVADKDRFVGRRGDLARLRGYVDELASESALESVTRGIARVFDTVGRYYSGQRRGVLMLEARGGLGKSTLLAKFILDHARAPGRHIPTVYFDFDQASLQPRQPAQLTIEAARQLALQFPDVQAQLGEVIEAARGVLRGSDRQNSDWRVPLATLRQLISRELTRGQCAFLLVLDTMEVVQPDAVALKGVQAFVDALYVPEFPELRVVVSGRASVDALLVPTRSRSAGSVHLLQPLTVPEARQLVGLLGSALIKQGWQTVWAERLAGSVHDDPQRREPLALRVAVELLRAAEESEREALSIAIEKMLPHVRGGFVGPLYQRRILQHVRDSDVRKLAWPGLVLRRLTREIVRDLLLHYCDIAADRLDAVYDLLAGEVWIVQREGDGLRHRADLRSRTLPLMREYRNERGEMPFAAINAAAVQYFGERRHSDPAAWAEWIYHRLLADEDLAGIERDWNDGLVAALAEAEEDFEPDSAAYHFLLARTERKLMSAERVLRWAPRRALEHIARTAPQLAQFDEQRLLPLLTGLEIDAGTAAPFGLATVQFALLVKTGRWRGLQVQEHNAPVGWQGQYDFALNYLASHQRAGGRILPRRDTDSEVPAQAQHALRLGSLTCHLQWAQAHDAQQYAWCDRTLALLLDSRDVAGAASIPYLRILVNLGRKSAAPALRCLARNRFLAGKEAQCVSAAEVRALLRSNPDSSLHDSLRKANAPLLDATLKDQRLALRIDEREWFSLVERQLEHLLAQMNDAPESPQAATLRDFAAASQPDWLIPIAYAAARCSAGEIPGQVGLRIAEHRHAARGLFSAFRSERPEPLPDDVLQVLRLADEASDLADTARLFLIEAVSQKDADDLALLLSHLSAIRLGALLPSPIP